MDLLLIGILCFIAGALCFYWPFRKWKQKISALIPPIWNHKGKKTSEVTAHPPSSFFTPPLEQNLELYLTYLRDQNKTLLEKLFLSKRISHEISSAIQEFVIILDKKGQVLFHNPQSQQVFYLKEKSPAPLQINEMVRSPDVISLFEECVNQKIPRTRQCDFRKKNQNIKSSFKVTALPVFKNFSDSFFFRKTQGPVNPIEAEDTADPIDQASNPQNSLQKVILIFQDQTAIQESQQAHIDFVSNVSHELKTPLTALQGYVEMLIQDFSRKNMEQFENFLQILLKNCKRMNDLVNDLLVLSNLISQANVEKQKLSTKKVTEKVIKNIKSKTHHLHCSFLTDYVTGHPLWVETVLHNLVDNACRHTPEKSDVHILWEKAKDKVLLKVRDTGAGIPEKYQQRVFERFFRIDPARSRLKGGTGVGLSLVKQALEKQGGSVRVVSAPEQGAEFICEFPNV